MAWYAILYIVLLIALGAASTADAVKERRSVPFIAVDALVSLTWPTVVVLFWYPAWAPPRPALLVALLLALGWSLAETWRELSAARAARPAADDPELSPRANLWIDRAVEASGALVAWALVVPALAAAAMLFRSVR